MWHLQTYTVCLILTAQENIKQFLGMPRSDWLAVCSVLESNSLNYT